MKSNHFHYPTWAWRYCNLNLVVFIIIIAVNVIFGLNWILAFEIFLFLEQNDGSILNHHYLFLLSTHIFCWLMLIITIMNRSIRWTTTHKSVGRKQLFPYFYSLLSLVLASIHAPSFSVRQTAEPVLCLFFQPNEVSILLSKHQTVIFVFIQDHFQSKKNKL